ncbi:H-NS family nucleoid-associated regulatory protein [Variovorax sp. J22P271]|uniref:H-NS family nucleoid-associated regulatory protein n=1 Tax=Variovorax davisae TaxID=3053515 RepID=UPI002577EC27|nr:H-NS family nucleoid-associated regulatory protein [Variovorax sp. J22P271]MDM0032382.1 H-NS family nucleoid-associated regulatory protein [Variovorax sp. J22P271]
MTNTYSLIQQKIAKPQKEADALRQKETSGVVARIKVAIEHYGLTAEQLGFVGAKASGKAMVLGKAKVLGKAASGAKYRDGNGQSWSGRGPRPRWLRDAIAGGASLESFLAVRGAAVAAPLTAKGMGIKAAKAAKSRRRPSTVLYQDGAGNSWTGRGPQPRWLKDTLAGGKTLEEMRG